MKKTTRKKLARTPVSEKYIGQKPEVAELCESIDAALNTLRRRIAQYRNGLPSYDQGYLAQQIRKGKVCELAKSIADCSTVLTNAKIMLAPMVEEELTGRGKMDRKNSKKRGGRSVTV